VLVFGRHCGPACDLVHGDGAERQFCEPRPNGWSAVLANCAGRVCLITGVRRASGIRRMAYSFLSLVISGMDSTREWQPMVDSSWGRGNLEPWCGRA